MNDLARTSPLAGFYGADGFAPTVDTPMRTGGTRRLAFEGAPFIADLSPLARRYVCGAGAGAWLAALGLPTPELCAWAAFGRDGWVAHTGPREWLVSAGGATPLPDALAAPAGRDDVHAFDHECVEIALGGAGVRAMFAELTATDLDQFAPGAFVPVLLAGNECWLRALPAPHAHWRVCCAPADATFVFGTLLALVREAGGALFGLDDFFSAHLTEEGQS
ncbi:MAG: hypothetical protein HY943_03160 [Gammaproteobacteria bacterium]|nr:hypothetical protein [Gammaproteobacteria bacterium]